MRRGAFAGLALLATALGTGAFGVRALGAQSGASPAARHTAADVAFMQGMIHHHAQAVAMAALVPARTSRADLRSLAARIDVSQVDEMAAMVQWLKDRGAAVPEVADGPAVHGTAGAHAGHAAGAAPAAPAVLMPGMLTAEELSALERSQGAAFERLFLAGMIKHHEGALAMVRALLATPGAGQETATFAFASDIDADQRAEIARMRRLLEALGPG